MKINTTGTIALLVVLTCGTGIVSAQPFEFRNTNWGMSVASVKQTEKGNIVSEKPMRIIYDCMLGDEPVKVVYTFTSSGKLMRAKYLIDAEYFNSLFYIRDYKMLQDMLTTKYGKALMMSPRAISKDGIAEEEWAAYLSAGELFVETKWVTGKTEILLTLSKVANNPEIQIDYISIEFSKTDLQEKAAKIAKDL